MGTDVEHKLMDAERRLAMAQQAAERVGTLQQLVDRLLDDVRAETEELRRRAGTDGP
jgi:phage shock protein A